MYPLFSLITSDGRIQLSEEDAADEKCREIIFDIAFRLLELARKRIEEAGAR